LLSRGDTEGADEFVGEGGGGRCEREFRRVSLYAENGGEGSCDEPSSDFKSEFIEGRRRPGGGEIIGGVGERDMDGPDTLRRLGDRAKSAS